MYEEKHSYAKDVAIERGNIRSSERSDYLLHGVVLPSYAEPRTHIIKRIKTAFYAYTPGETVSALIHINDSSRK